MVKDCLPLEASASPEVPGNKVAQPAQTKGESQKKAKLAEALRKNLLRRKHAVRSTGGQGSGA